MNQRSDDVPTSRSCEELIREFRANADYKDYRHGYAEESLNLSVSTQIKVLREQRGWRQEDLAQEAEMTQPMISRYEKGSYPSWSISTLKKLAEAFDVWLDVRFRSFGELVTTTEEFSRETLEVPSFSDDKFFAVSGRKVRKRRPSSLFENQRSTTAVGRTDIRQMTFSFDKQNWEPTETRVPGGILTWINKTQSSSNAPKTSLLSMQTTLGSSQRSGTFG